MYDKFHIQFVLELSLNKTESAIRANMQIPSSSVCQNSVEQSFSGDNDDEFYTYDYPKICNGKPTCNKTIDGVEYVYYDLYTLFGDCSMAFHIPNSNYSIVV